jgi:hypothetical protein
MKRIKQIAVSFSLIPLSLIVPILSQPVYSAPAVINYDINHAYSKPTAQPTPFEQLSASFKIKEDQRIAAEAKAARVAAANKAAQDALQAQAVQSTAPVIKASSGMPSGVEKLKNCESGGDYAKNTGNGYYGAYQYDISTWGGFGGYARPDLAPPSIQDAKFLQTYNARGKSPWPSCGRFLP